MSYLIDTNVLSELTRAKPNNKVLEWIGAIPDDTLFLSVLTLSELRKGVEGVSDIRKKEKLLIWLEHELVEWFGDRILPVNKEVADRWGYLQYEMRRPLPAIDSLIAATALHYDLRMVTRNTVDFEFPSLQIINPWQL